MANQNVQYDDEISLKDLITKFWEYFWHVLKRWKLIALFVILSIIYQIYKAVTHNTKYIAPITFMINEDESSSLGGIGSLLGSFGGLLGGAGSEFNLDKILQISTSNRVASNMLLNKITINNRTDYLANHLIETKDTLGEWIDVKLLDKVMLPNDKIERKKLQKAFRFNADTLNYNDGIQAYIIKKCLKELFGGPSSDGMVSTEYGELTGIMNLKTETYNSKLSISITTFLYEELKKFYIEKSIEKQKQTYNIMKAKHDSINNALLNFEYSLANYKDTGRGLFREKDKLRKDQLQRNITINTMALGKAKENLEISDFALKDKTPFVQVIDRPYSPLDNDRPNIIFAIIIGGLIGGFLSVGYIVIRKIYQDIMKN